MASVPQAKDAYDKFCTALAVQKDDELIKNIDSEIYRAKVTMTEGSMWEAPTTEKVPDKLKVACDLHAKDMRKSGVKCTDLHPVLWKKVQVVRRGPEEEN